MKFIDLSGKRFGRLIVIRRAGHQSRHITWLCKCDCGAMATVCGNHLPNGHTQSCGCFDREQRRDRLITHGAFVGGKESLTHNSWRLMLARCYDLKCKSFSDYGGRGIKVCARWRHSFENFLADMGERPEGTTIDRKDNDGNYCKTNCRWAGPLQQSNNSRHNRRIRVGNQVKNISEWSRHSGINAMTIKNRLNAGWDTKRAVSKPPRQIRKTSMQPCLL